MIHTLAYADDVALANHGDDAGIVQSSERVTSIASGARKDGDMDVSIKKTKVLQVREQDAVSPTTTEEANKESLQICLQALGL